MLNDDEVAAFRGALRDYCNGLAEFPSELTPEMRVALVNAAKAAKAARAGGLSAEHFVIWVKQVWDELMDDRVLQHSSKRVLRIMDSENAGLFACRA